MISIIKQLKKLMSLKKKSTVITINAVNTETMEKWLRNGGREQIIRSMRYKGIRDD